MVIDKTAKTTKAGKLLLILLIVLATLIGLAPVSMALGRPQFIIYFTAGSLLIAVVYTLRTNTTTEVVAPGLLAYLLAGVGALGLVSTIGISMLIFYGFIYGAAWLITQIASWLGASWAPNFDLIALYPTMIIIGMGAIGIIYRSLEKITQQLYPTTAGAKHAFHELVTKRKAVVFKWTMIALLSLAFIVSIFIIFRLRIHPWLYVVMQLYLFYVGRPLSQLSEEKRRSPARKKNAIEACNKLFAEAGYQTVFSPKTEKPEIDPLLVGTDLFVYNNEHAFALGIKQAGVDKEPITWVDALSVQTAARTLSNASRELEIPTENVEPILVLIDIKPDETLREFVKDESMCLVEMEGKEVREILNSKEQSKSQALAFSFLEKIPATHADKIAA